MRIRSAVFVKTKPFLYEVRISGSDYFGEWQGFGQFLQTADQRLCSGCLSITTMLNGRGRRDSGRI